MHTVASLKAQYKTLAAAKKAFNIRANSWQALVDKLSPPPPPVEDLKERVKQLEAEVEMLKKRLAVSQIADSIYFVSPEAEIVYSVVKLDGEARLKALGVNKTHYRDAKKAKEWRNRLAMKIHPDKCAHPQAAAAMEEITAIYENMVAA